MSDVQKTPIQHIYEGLAAKNPDLKEYGFDAFANDMKDENNLKSLYSGLAEKNPTLKETGFDSFKSDLWGDQSDTQQEQPLTYMQKELRARFPENYTDEQNPEVQPQNNAPKESGSVATELNQQLKQGTNETIAATYGIPGYAYDFVGAGLRALGLNVPTYKESGLTNDITVAGVDINPLSILDQAKENLLTFSKQNAEKVRELNPDIDKGVVEPIQNGEYKKAIRNLFSSMTQSAPASAAMMLSGGLSTPMQVGAGAALFGSQNLNQADQEGDYGNVSRDAVVAISSVTGALESIFETTFGSGAAGKAISNIIKKEGKEQAAETIKKGFTDNVIKLITENPWMAPFGEAYEEMGTQLAQNAVNKYSGYKPDINLMDGVYDAGLLGFGMGSVHGGLIEGTKRIVNSGDSTTSTDNTGSQQPTGPVSSDSAPQFTISPRQQAEFDLRSTASQFANNETGLLQTIQEATPDGQENRIWFIKAGQTTDPDGSILVEDEAGNSKFLTKEQIAGEPNNMTIDDFVNMKLSEYDQTQQNQELLKQNQIQIDGKQYILTGYQTNKGLIALNTDDGSETVIPFNVVEKIKGSGTSNANIIQRAYGKTNVTGIKNDDGSITLTDNYDLDKANSLKEEIEKSTGGKATIQAELIPNEDSTLPDSYQLSIIPVQSNIDTSTENIQETNQNVTTTPSQDNNVSTEQPRYTLNGNEIDQITAKARVRAAILKGSADKLAGLEISNDPELSGMIEKAFPKPKAKFTLGKKTISPEDAMDWIIAADNFNELNELKSENIDSEPAIAEAFRAKVKYFTPTQREIENSVNIEKANQEKVSETQQQISEQQQIENSESQESSQNNKLSNEESENVNREVAGTAPQAENIPQEEQGQGVNEGLEENVTTNESTVANVMAADYLFNGGVGVLSSSDYLIKSLTGAFTKASGLIEQIRQRYSREINDSNLGYIKDFVNTELYNKVMADIRNAINTSYNNNQEVIYIFDQILQYPTGLPVKLGTQLSIQLESINDNAVPPVATISQTPEDSAPLINETTKTENAIDQAASEVNTNPTDAQKEAGNYKKGHVTIQGMDITIENPKGSFRSGVDEDGKAWETEMKSHYGYFKRTNGKDGDHIDTFIGENPESQTVFVVDQNNPKTGEFDESKVMLGYNDAEEAKAAYLSNYEPNWKGFGSITPVSVEDFKTWLYDGARQRKPFSEYKDTPAPIEENNIPDVSLESDQVRDVAGQDSGQRPAVKEPWQMTFNEYLDETLKRKENDPKLFYNPITHKYETQKSVESSLYGQWSKLNEQAFIDGKSNKKPAWARTLKEHVDLNGEGSEQEHKLYVKQALSEGKPVPEEVLNDYPELQPRKPLNDILEDAVKAREEKKQSTPLPEEPKKPLMDVLKEGKEVIEGKKLTPELTLYNVPESFNEKSFIEFNRALAKGEVNVDQFKKAFEVLLSSKDAIISELNGMTKAELLKGMSGMGQYRYKNEKKDATVKAIWSDHLMDFAFGSISYTFDGTPMEQIVAKKVANTTQKNIDDYVAETQKRKQEYINRVQEFKKALTNPETLPEFRIFIDKNGLDKLSPEQKAAYDNMVTDKTIEKRNAVIENKSVVSKVDLAGVEMDITETKHTKTGVPLFVVKLSERVSKEDYQDLNSKAKQLGGYYSSFRGQGAVPGFQFKTREQAQKFVDLKKQDASNLDLIEEKQDTKLADRVSKLRENAQKIIDRVDSELSKDRLTNTAKRASQAASTEARLGKEKQIAQTMINIANAIENGDVKLLDGVKAKTHIELLDGLINQAKYKEISADSPTYTERMAREGEPATVKTVEFAQDSFYPNIYADHIKSLIDKVGDRSGVKLIASRWSKKLLSTKSQDYYKVKSQSEVDELTDMVNALRGNEKSYNRVAEEIADYNRLKSMGIENDSMLRAALREYVQYRGKSQEVDKVKKLERALVGRKNIGIDFFPTPKETAQLMVDEAGITEGMDVLEPSAGNGNIADAIKETGVQPDVIELSFALSEVLEAKGYDVVASDFMDFDGKKYDRIVMNPPFSNGMDGDHVQHAYELLKPGGRIVAIVGEGTFIRNDKKAVAFREWLDEVGGTEEKLNQGTFQDRTLLNTTGANARLVVIDKSQSDANFRIIGETGAANLDKAEEATTRLDNLAIAREMERAGKDVKSIRLATGWEKGVDSKWRYEVPDFEFSEGVKRLINQQKKHGISETWVPNEMKLNEVISDDELFKSYPEFNDVLVSITVRNDQSNKGSFSSNLLDLELGSINVQANNFENFKSVLAHEIQHGIQTIEGFAQGGKITNYPDKQFESELYQVEKELKKAVELKNSDQWVYNSSSIEDIIKSGDTPQRVKEWAINIAKEGESGIKEFLANTPIEQYRRLAGEVESRNVQSRMNMTPEERLNTLLSETEDVAREDQIVLMDGLGVSNLDGEFEYTDHQNLIDKLESGAIETDEVILDDNEGLALQLAGKISENDLNEIRNSGRDLGGFEIFGKVYINSIISPIEVVKTWIHEKTHRQLKRIFPQKARREQFLNRVFDHVGEKEINATLPKIYHGDSREQRAEEYIAFKVQEYGMTGNVNADPEIKKIIFELLNRFTTLKNIQDATRGINLAQQGSGKRNAHDGLRGRSGLQENGRTSGNGEPNFNRGLRQDESRKGTKESRIAELALKSKNNPSVFSEYLSEAKRVVSEKQSQPENTILIDGKLRSTVNSKGLPIAQTEEGIRNFWKWFGDSKVIDDQGRPLVVYHGTDNNFTKFNKGRVGAIFFSDDQAYSKSYGKNQMPVYLKSENLADIIDPYSKSSVDAIEIFNESGGWEYNEMVMDERENSDFDPEQDETWELLDNHSVAEGLQELGYDGIKMNESLGDKKFISYAVFYPNQIKSATGNNSSFDPDNNDIRYSRGEVPLNDYLEEAARQNQEEKKTRRNLSEVAEGVREFIQDHDLPIRRLEEKVKQLGGKIADNMKPYRDMSLSYGRMETLYKKFTKDKFEPIIKTISKIVKSGTPAGEVLPYVICKHALERNPYMRAIELKEWQDNAEIELKKWTDANIDIPQATKDRKVKEFTDALEAKRQELSKKDYSGVRGFDPSNNFETPDELAQEIVDEFERKTPIGLVDELWSNVKNATSEIVDIWGKGQTMSEEQVQQTKDRFKYFVPLRGWRHGVAKQLVYKKGEGFSGSLQRIKGRTSIAENPLAYIEQIAFKALGEQVDNEVKTSLLNLVVGNYSDDFQQLYRLKKAYYIKDGIDENGEQMWKLTTERPSEELFKSGDAVTKIYNQYQKLRTPSQAHEHEVYVKRPNGDLVVVMVGDMLPVAQSMNKKNTMYRNLFTGKPNDAEFWNKPLSATIGAWNNTLKGMYTAYNIVFPITNFMRDAQEASITQFIKGDNGHLVVKNYKNAFPAIIRSLRGKESGGKYDEMLKEFRETGGNTGYTHLKTPEQLEKEINSELEMLNRTGTFRGYTIDKARKALSAIEAWNQIFEDATRFSVYITSREAGKSAKEAANDSKEASVNFNRKGKSSKAFDSVWAFWNVAIQSMQKNFKLAKDYPKRFSMVAGAWLALGFLEAMMNDAMGGDDDKDYYNISDYVRENYLIIPVLFGDKKDKYLRIPLPQFWRGFKSAGSIAYDVMNGKMDGLSATAKGLGNFLGGLLPIDIGGFYQNGEFSMAPVIPTIIRPVYEVKANRDYMGYTIAKEPFTKEQERLLAASGLGKDNVSPAIKFFTDYLFRAGGGDNETRFYTQNGDIKKVPGIFDYNPSYIEHLITGYTGGTGKFVTDVLTTAIDGLDTEKEVDFRNTPFINQFIKKIPEAKWKVIGEYYDIKSEGNESAFGQLKRSYFSQEDKTKYKEVAGSNYLNEYNAVVNDYDERLTTMMQYMDYKTAEGSEEVINTMKDAIEAIKQVKQKYNKK